MKFDLNGNSKSIFGDVEVGEVFLAYGGYVCMKIERIDPKIGKPVNCVFLDDGSLGLYEDTNYIIRIVKNVTLREEE